MARSGIDGAGAQHLLLGSTVGSDGRTRLDDPQGQLAQLESGPFYVSSFVL